MIVTAPVAFPTRGIANVLRWVTVAPEEEEACAAPPSPTDVARAEYPNPASPAVTIVTTRSATVARVPYLFTEARRMVMVTTFIT